MNQNRGFRPKFAPVNVGDELEVKIEAVGEKGDGIARKEGFVLFVPNTKEGDEVKIRVSRVLRNVGFAEVVGQAESKPEEAQPEGTESDAIPEQQEQSDKEPQEDKSEGEEVKDTEDFGEELEENK